MLTVALIAEIVSVIGFPVLLGAWLRRRYRVSWLLFAAGAITFGVSQAVHLPLNNVVLGLLDEADAHPIWTTALLLGLTAGLCEEIARYVAYRWALPGMREWREALMFGAGHGGIESIILVGLMVGVTLLNMAALQASDLETWGLSAAQSTQLESQLEGYWGQAWTIPLLAAAERFFSIVFHIGMAVLVLQAVVRRRAGYLLLAIVMHAAVNGLALVVLDAGWSLVATEALIGLFALAALGIIVVFRPAEAVPQKAETYPEKASLPSLCLGRPGPVSAEDRLRRQIEESKYQ
jgi:uncharacterized membrane protein YhfC